MHFHSNMAILGAYVKIIRSVYKSSWVSKFRPKSKRVFEMNCGFSDRDTAITSKDVKVSPGCSIETLHRYYRIKFCHGNTGYSQG